MKKFITGITMYRLLSAPVLLILLLAGNVTLFKWLIALSYLTDAVDGTLARKFNAVSTFGSRLDSVADESTVFVSAVALYMLYRDFFLDHLIVIVVLVVLYLSQNAMAFLVYGRASSFHTILAKIAAVSQGVFFIMMFFDLPLASLMFYPAAILTIIEVVEEMIITTMLSEWRADVKGVFWLLREQKRLSGGQSL